MENLYFNKTKCRCILKLQAQEDLQNPRCLRCLAVSEKKKKYDEEMRKGARIIVDLAAKNGKGKT